MKFTLILLVIPSFNAHAKNETKLEEQPNIMELVLFLNANQAKNGAASFKADHEKKTLQYFDADGRLIEEAYIDANNDIVSKTYTKDGKVLKEDKLTEASILAGIDQAQADHNQKDVPQIKAILQAYSTAAENYAKAHQGTYPRKMVDLTGATPPYLNTCSCDETIEMYRIQCELHDKGYKFMAKSIWPQYESYVISTGEKMEVKQPGELTAEMPFVKSPSPCREFPY